MYCDACGAPMQAESRFCPACGKPAGGAAAGAPIAAPARGRVESHIRVLGVLWIVLSLLRLLPALVLLSLGSSVLWPMPHHLPGFVAPLLGVLGTAIAISAVLGLVAGWGLLARQSWARMLAIVLGCVVLIDLPFGTALGIYTLWVLAPAESETEFRRLAGSN